MPKKPWLLVQVKFFCRLTLFFYPLSCGFSVGEGWKELYSLGSSEYIAGRSRVTRWDTPPNSGAFATFMPPRVSVQNQQGQVASLEKSTSQVSPTSTFDEHMSRWKYHFCSLGLWKHLCLAHVVDWAGDMDCFDDDKLVADCLDFLDFEAHVSHKLGPITMYIFLHYFFFF